MFVKEKNKWWVFLSGAWRNILMVFIFVDCRAAVSCLLAGYSFNQKSNKTIKTITGKIVHSLDYIQVSIKLNETAVELHVYRKGPPIGIGWVMQGWVGSYRGWVGHAGKGWFIQGWGGSWRGGVGQAEVGWVMQGWVGHAGLRWCGYVGVEWVCRCGVGWVMQDGVRWVIQGWGQVVHTEVGWGGSWKILKYWKY